MSNVATKMPPSSMFSEKLHANGQMIQEGERNLIETFLKLERFDSAAPIPAAASFS